MNTLSKHQAQAQGKIRYFTGVPCRRGHVSERQVSTGACCECQSMLNRERYISNQTEILGAVRKYREENPEKVRETNRKSRARHAEKWRDYDKSRFVGERREKAIAKLAKWNAANPERTKARIVAWKRANPAKVNAISARYRAAKMQATPSWANDAKIERAYELCAEYRAKGINAQVDHIIPLQGEEVCGLHVHYNLQIVDGKYNRSKSNRVL